MISIDLHLHLFTDLRGYVKRLLGVEGAIFNLKPIAQQIGTPEEATNQVMKSWRNEDDQLELLLQPWLKETDETKGFDDLRMGLQELKEEGQLPLLLVTYSMLQIA